MRDRDDFICHVVVCFNEVNYYKKYIGKWEIKGKVYRKLYDWL